MVWIFAAVVLLLAVLSPRFRKFGLALAGATIVIIVALILLNERNKPNPAPAAIDPKARPAAHSRIPDLDDYLIERQDKDDPEAKTRISLTEVRFGQIKPTFGPQANAIQSIQARLYNDSTRFSLTDYSYYLIVQDCVGTEPMTHHRSMHHGVRSASARNARRGPAEPGQGYHDFDPG